MPKIVRSLSGGKGLFAWIEQKFASPTDPIAAHRMDGALDEIAARFQNIFTHVCDGTNCPIAGDLAVISIQLSKVLPYSRGNVHSILPSFSFLMQGEIQDAVDQPCTKSSGSLIQLVTTICLLAGKPTARFTELSSGVGTQISAPKELGKKFNL